ncbi:MAG TPA: tetratricopeptide repeat protein [Bryobacteraceae bacterium]|jgi:tetratricopeptide (TPR) repeat protein
MTTALAAAQDVAKNLETGTRSSAADQTTPITGVPNLTTEMRADIMMARKMYREAIDMYKQAPQDSPVILNKIGIAYHQLAELQMAKRYYEQAARMKPDYAEAINNLGTVYYAKKSYRKAITEYKKSLELSPESAAVLMNLGTAYFSRKNYELALATYQDALKLDPEVFEHRGTQGTTLEERSVEERAKFHFYLAKTYAKAGSTDRALLYLRKCLEEGFKDKRKILEQPEFASLKDLDEFKQIMSMEQKVL